MTDTISRVAGNAAKQNLKQIASEARHWLHSAADFWSNNGRSFGLFAERLSLSGEHDAVARRIFVQSRHIYSFCIAGRLGWDGPWRPLIEETLEILLSRARRSDGFFVHRLTHDGQAEDLRADLYDQAFMLFMLGHAANFLQRDDLIAVAVDLTDKLEECWRRPEGGFFEGELVAAGVRLQNPHMHLLEAFLVLHEVTGIARFQQLAREMLALCENHFIDQSSGALLEYFDEQLLPLAGEQGKIVEPGHCFEWAWLLEKTTWAPQARHLSGRLTEFGRRWGVDPVRNVAVNEVFIDGSKRNTSARLWPQTERLKAALARFQYGCDPSEADEVKLAYLGLRQYLTTNGAITWRDKLDPNGQWIDEPSPGSSLYHIACAYNELINCMG